MMADDNIQHGIDDNTHNDPEKGAVLGGVGGAVVGALAGGPIGAVIGAVAGAVGSGAGVAAVHDGANENNVTGLGDGVTTDAEVSAAHVANRVDDVTPGNNVAGVQTGGYTTAGEDTRGLTEKAADVITGDKTDDNTGGRVVNS